jgi:hypothetical protein
MREGAVHVVTVGSNWWLDESTGEYLRLPLREEPRERPEWGDERAGALQDATWMAFSSWRIDKERLWIDGELGQLSAPLPQVVGADGPAAAVERMQARAAELGW